MELTVLLLVVTLAPCVVDDGVVADDVVAVATRVVVVNDGVVVAVTPLAQAASKEAVATPAVTLVKKPRRVT